MTQVENCQNNKDLVSQFLGLMGSNLDAAFEYLTDDATWFTLSNREHVPREQIKGMITFVYESLLQGPIQQDIQIMTAEEDRVAVISKGQATTVNGEAYNNLYHFLFEFSNGKICRIWEFNDATLVRDVLLPKDGGLDSLKQVN